MCRAGLCLYRRRKCGSIRCGFTGPASFFSGRQGADLDNRPISETDGYDAAPAALLWLAFYTLGDSGGDRCCRRRCGHLAFFAKPARLFPIGYLSACGHHPHPCRRRFASGRIFPRKTPVPAQQRHSRPVEGSLYFCRRQKFLQPSGCRCRRHCARRGLFVQESSGTARPRGVNHYPAGRQKLFVDQRRQFLA